MSQTRALVVCDSCAGKGTVPHQVRRIGTEAAEKKPDPWDFQTVELCAKCGGGARMPGTAPKEG